MYYFNHVSPERYIKSREWKMKTPKIHKIFTCWTSLADVSVKWRAQAFSHMLERFGTFDRSSAHQLSIEGKECSSFWWQPPKIPILRRFEQRPCSDSHWQPVTTVVLTRKEASQDTRGCIFFIFWNKIQRNVSNEWTKTSSRCVVCNLRIGNSATFGQVEKIHTWSSTEFVTLQLDSRPHGCAAQGSLSS